MEFLAHDTLALARCHSRSHLHSHYYSYTCTLVHRSRLRSHVHLHSHFTLALALALYTRTRTRTHIYIYTRTRTRSHLLFNMRIGRYWIRSKVHGVGTIVAASDSNIAVDNLLEGACEWRHPYQCRHARARARAHARARYLANASVDAVLFGLCVHQHNSDFLHCFNLLCFSRLH
jgi:hypothetical protein